MPRAVPGHGYLLFYLPVLAGLSIGFCLFNYGIGQCGIPWYRESWCRVPGYGYFLFKLSLLIGFFGLDWLSSSSVQYPACAFYIEVTFYWFSGRLDDAELGVES